MSRPRVAPEIRFWKQVQKTKTCWLWLGYVAKNAAVGKSYGRFTLPDNPRCVRPDHLKLGTQQDNVDDMWRKGRARDCRGRQLPARMVS